MSDFILNPDIRVDGDPELGEYAPVKTQCFFPLEVRESKMSSRIGRGVFAKVKIPKGSIVFIGGGQLISSVVNVPPDKDYIGVFNERYFIAPVDYSAPSPNWLMNHSCVPNIKVVGGLVVMAKRDICEQEELSIDYGAIMAGDYSWEMACACGSSKCRGTITNEDWKDAEYFKAIFEELPSFVQLRGIAKGMR